MRGSEFLLVRGCVTVMKEFRCVDWTHPVYRRFVSATALGGVLLGAGSLKGHAQARTSCADLTKLDIPEATVTMAEVVQPLEFKLPARTDNPGAPGGGPPGAGNSNGPGPGGPNGQGAPGDPRNNGSGGGGMNMALAPFDPKDTTNHVSFCRVAATLKPSGDSDIKIEVWLPLSGWNGKLMGAGNFGWAGSIMYGGLLLGLEHRYATVSTDTGHDNSLVQGAFALGHPDKMIDYGYRAAHCITGCQGLHQGVLWRVAETCILVRLLPWRSDGTHGNPAFFQRTTMVRSLVRRQAPLSI